MKNYDKYTLITGGTEGIGFELSKLFARDGHNLIIIARNEEKLVKVQEQLEKEFSIKVKILSLDLSVNNSCEKLFAFVEKNELSVDNLVNNAGVGSFGALFYENVNTVDNLIKININSLTNITYYFLKKMVANNEGSILNVASTAAFSAGPKMGVYYASKAYVLSLTESIHEEVRDKNIKVSCLCPGAVRTGFQGKAGIIKNEKAKSLMMEARDVAKVAYKEFKKGKAIIIPGYKNKILVWANKFIPRSLARKIVMYSNK